MWFPVISEGWRIRGSTPRPLSQSSEHSDCWEPALLWRLGVGEWVLGVGHGELTKDSSQVHQEGRSSMMSWWRATWLSPLPGRRGPVGWNQALFRSGAFLQ